MSARLGLLLSPLGDGRVRAQGRATPHELERLRASKADLAPIAEAFGEVRVAFRPATPVPPKITTADIQPKVLGPARKPPPPKPREERPPPPVRNPCVHCERSTDPADLTGSIPLADGRWEHLQCWLNTTKEASP
jgi:hypothetical protein